MRILCIASLLLALSGCAGTNFTFDQARQVKVGMTASEVTSIMGRPYAVNSRDGAEIWVWSRANGFTGSSRAVSFTLRNGIVENVPVIPDDFGGSRQQVANGVSRAPAPKAVAEAAPAATPLSQEDYRKAQIEQLMQQNLPYDEYQRRYKAIMAQ